MSIFDHGGSGPLPTVFQIVTAIATAENVVRLEFTAAPYFDGLLSSRDASSPDLFTVSPLDGTASEDGSPAREVGVVRVRVTDTSDAAIFPPGSKGRFLDLLLDRPLTGYPAEYAATIDPISLLWTLDIVTLGDMTQLDSLYAFASFFGVFKATEAPPADPAVARRDIANASTGKAIGATSDETGAQLLGTFSYDEAGDYAADAGEVSLFKRVFRRVFARPGAFAHLGPNYGLGIAQHGKKLLAAGFQQKIQAEASRQIQREPEVQAARVTWAQDKTDPSLVRMFMIIRTRTRTLKYEAPFRLAG